MARVPTEVEAPSSHAMSVRLPPAARARLDFNASAVM
jgi:hypothetical protein